MPNKTTTTSVREKSPLQEIATDGHSVRSAAKLTTEEAASILKAAKQTPRASLCRLGHWLGMRPVKLPNGRLLWDANEVERLAKGEGE